MSGQTAHKKILVTGCGGSGTHFMADLLKASGLSVYHENSWGEDGIVDWRYASEGAKKFLNCQDSFQIVWHQVRYPLKVINFSQTFLPHSWELIMDNIPEIEEKDLLIVKAAKYWYYWNLQAEKQASFTYQIEQFLTVCPTLESQLGISFDIEFLERCHEGYGSRESRHPEELTWQKLRSKIDVELFEHIVDLARKYGYAISNDDLL